MSSIEVIQDTSVVLLADNFTLLEVAFLVTRVG